MGIVDACLHQWTIPENAEELHEHLPEKDRVRQGLADRRQGRVSQLSGTIMPSTPWYHAFWNEDAPPEAPSDEEYTDSEQYNTPELVDEYLAANDIDAAVLNGHEITYLPGLLESGYKASLASAYNTILEDEWLSASDRMKGGIVVTASDPDAAVEEIEQYADHPDFVTVLLFGGGDTPLGDSSLLPIYEAAVAADLPVTIHSSGNPVHRQSALGPPQHYVVEDANRVQNHMANLTNILINGVFDTYPELEIIWAGEGATWAMHPMWRSTRYYRNFHPLVKTDLDREPHERVLENCYFTTYPLGDIEGSHLESLFEMVGTDSILYGSGYPRWDANTPDQLEQLPDDLRKDILSDNAKAVYGL